MKTKEMRLLVLVFIMVAFVILVITFFNKKTSTPNSLCGIECMLQENHQKQIANDLALNLIKNKIQHLTKELDKAKEEQTKIIENKNILEKGENSLINSGIVIPVESSFLKDRKPSQNYQSQTGKIVK